jgi:hypothetical protein
MASEYMDNNIRKINIGPPAFNISFKVNSIKTPLNIILAKR